MRAQYNVGDGKRVCRTPGSLHGAGGGYLANLSPSEFAQHYEEDLPEQMAGADFLAQCGAHWDAATQVLPSAPATEFAYMGSSW